MSRFTDRLWNDLVRKHGAELAQIERKPSHRIRRPRILAGTGAGAAAAGTAIVLLLGGASTSPAFAVTKNNDGSVTVTITRLGGISGANYRLQALGYRARLVQVAAGCAPGWAHKAAENWTVKVPPALARKAVQISVNTRFDPRQIPPGRLLVIAAWARSRSVYVAPAHLVRGAAPACLPAPPPPPVIIRSGLKGGHCMVVVPPPGQYRQTVGRRPVTGNFSGSPRVQYVVSPPRVPNRPLTVRVGQAPQGCPKTGPVGNVGGPVGNVRFGILRLRVLRPPQAARPGGQGSTGRP